jgi:predicted naringenin-chalcone synthase
MSAPACIRSIGTANPDHEIHGRFVDWAASRLADAREQRLFRRMAERSGIERRWTVLPTAPDGGSPVAPGGFYEGSTFPPTSARMAAYATLAPRLAMKAIRRLDFDPAEVTHLVVASCTGLVAPGIDQILARELGLSPRVERLLIGFMGCYAGVAAQRAARHIARSDPQAVVLLVSIELATLHLEDTCTVETMLAMLQFSDGAAAAIVTAGDGPVRLGPGASAALPQSDTLIRWDIGEHGFVMRLSGEVPARIEAALGEASTRQALFAAGVPRHLAIHAGGRSILDAVERALLLPSKALAASRAVLADCGNMSSATVLFVIERLLRTGVEGAGMALAFGPGLAAEAIGLDFGA